MANAIRKISVREGYDPADYGLVAFGGAGGQHACALARILDINKIFIHRFAGILSAYGMGLADVVLEKQEPASFMLNSDSVNDATGRLDMLSDSAVREMKRRGYARIEVKRYLHLRYQGTDTALMIQEPVNGDYTNELRTVHSR